MKIMVDVPDDTVAMTVTSVRMKEEQASISCHTFKTKDNILVLEDKDGQWSDL